VDLERRETHTAFTPLAVTRTVLGGRGANMYYLHRLLDETLTPLDPDIPLIFGSGLLTGLVPSAARGNCTSWSPESSVLLDSSVPTSWRRAREHAVAAHRRRARAANVARRPIAWLNLLGRRGSHDEKGSGHREDEISHAGL
jgi:hypothetical protein